MGAKTGIDRRAALFIGIIVGGSLLMGMGVNLVLVHAGVLQGNSFKTTGIVASCNEDRSCQVNYDFQGNHLQATLEAPERYDNGEQVRITVFSNKLEKAYTEQVVPLGFAIVVATVGLTMLTFGALRLYQHWKRQRLMHEDAELIIDLKDERD